MDPLTVEEQRAAAKVKRAKARRFTVDNAPPPLLAAGVPEQFWPTRRQYTIFSTFIAFDKGADPDGWWYGYCPLHDPGQHPAGTLASAMFHWHYGAMRCLKDSPCHPGKTSITITDLLVRMPKDSTAS